MGDARDWFIMILVATVWAAATVYLFLHPSDANYVTYAGLCVTLAGVYHWIMVRDQKVADA